MPRRPSIRCCPGPLPPELEALGRDEVRAVFEEALLIGLRWTKSPDGARQLLSDLYVRMTTTQRWDPTQAPLRVFVMQTLRHLLATQPDRRPRPGTRAQGHGSLPPEIRPERVGSTEEMHLDAAY